MNENLTPKQRIRRKKIIRRRRALLLLLLVAIITGICLFTPFFNVKKVEVKGNSEITSEQITEAAAIIPGTNIFKINKKKVKKSLMTIPEIESVKVRRVLPAKIRLEVTETNAAMYFPYLSGFVLTNTNGRVMALTDTEEELGLLKITGLEIKNAEICKKISVQDTEQFDIIVNTIQAFSRVGLLQELRSCHFDDLSDFTVYLHDGTKLMFGKLAKNDPKRLEYQLSVLTKVLVQVNRTEGAYIDLTTPERTVYGVAEPEPAPEPEGEETETEETASEENTAPEETEEEKPADNDEDGNAKKGDNQL